MSDTTPNFGKTHPLILIAAIAVILTCLVALGVMTGVMPGSKRNAAPDVAATTAPGLNPQTQSALPPKQQFSVAPTPPVPPSRPLARTPGPAAGVGSTSPAAGAGSVAGGSAAQSAAAPVAPPPCTNCGTVVAVRAIKQQGDAGMIGPAAGALLGGVLGHQIGHGTGNTIATVVGAGAGAAAGTEVERRYKSTTSYVIDVRMNDGTVRHFSSPTAPTVETGSRVKVVDGKLMHA